MSNDVPESKVKRPLYLRDCMKGLIEQDNVDWTEACLRHAEELIKASPYATEEVVNHEYILFKFYVFLHNSSTLLTFIPNY